MRQATRLFDANRKLTKQDLVTIEPDDILQSSVFSDIRTERNPSTVRPDGRPSRKPMPRPIILGVVGDSAAGKTTMTRGLVRILGEQQVTAVSTDDYHRYDRKQRAERGITPLHPDCNYVDIMSQHLRHLRRGEPILKPVYVHADGTFGPPVYVDPKPFMIVEGLLGLPLRGLLRLPTTSGSTWRPPKTCAGGGRFGATPPGGGTPPIRCSRSSTSASPTPPSSSAPRSATLTSSSRSEKRDGGDPDALDAELLLRDSLPHPDLSPVRRRWRARRSRCTSASRSGWSKIAGDIEREQAADIEEAIWEKLHFASHLRSERLGEFTIGIDLHRSESLALVQLLIMYHLVTAKAARRWVVWPRAEAQGTAGRRPRSGDRDDGSPMRPQAEMAS